MRDTQPAAELVSYYVMGLAGHIVLAMRCLSIIIATRAIGAIVFVKLQFGTLRVLIKTCSVDAALGTRSKLILLSGYVWENGELYYEPSVLKALGILKAVEPDGCEYFVHTKLHWISIQRDNLVIVGTVSNKIVEPCPERQCSGIVSLFDHTLGGATTNISNITESAVVPITNRPCCCGIWKYFSKQTWCSSEVTPGPTPAKINVRVMVDDQIPRQVLPAWEVTDHALPSYI